jgi:D-3-phosphoglycerate dehydrogenase
MLRDRRRARHRRWPAEKKAVGMASNAGLDDAGSPSNPSGRMTLGPVIVTTPSFGKFSAEPWKTAISEGIDLQRSQVPGPLSSTELRNELGDAVGVIVGIDRLDRAAIEAAPNLRVIGKHGVGVDNIDLVAAAERGIPVVWTPGANASAVADMAMALLLAGARQLVEADASFRRGEWNVYAGIALEGTTVGVVGFGNIGQAVARRLAGFDAKVIAYDPFQPPEVFAKLGVRQVTMDQLIAESAIISLHLPFAPGERPLLGEAEFAKARPGVGIVNTARGGLIDDRALADALASGEVGFAALDAFTEEPLAHDSPLRTAPRTILTPHSAAFTELANARAGNSVVVDVARVLRGEAPHFPVR